MKSPALAPNDARPDGILHEIKCERLRQFSGEGWTVQHDDKHAKGEMAEAAACYALSGAGYDMRGFSPLHCEPPAPSVLSHVWPWSREWWKPGKRRRDLVKAAALIVAEIERLDRKTALVSGEVK